MEVISALNTALLMSAFLIAVLFIQRFMRQREREKKEQAEIEKERMEREHNLERDRLHMEDERMRMEAERLEIERKNAEKKENATSDTDFDAKGYIIIDMPEDKRSLFHDLLKGFEEYAKLKGYLIHFSVDSSIPDKIAFKFTLGESGINVSTGQVKRDLKEYLDKINSGQPLDDIPTVISPEEHDIILTTLKNRLSFLQMNYNIQKNTIALYEKVIDRITSSPHGFVPSANFYLQSGGAMDSRKYISTNSSNVIQGDDNLLLDSSIRIADSFNDKAEQIENIQNLVDALEKVEEDAEQKQRAIINLAKVKDELADEATPDKGRIAKWLEKTKDYLGTLKLANETVLLVKKVYESFNLTDLISNIF